MTLYQRHEKATEFWICPDDCGEILALPDQHFAAHDRLDAVIGLAFTRQYAFPGETQRDDLPPPAAIGHIFAVQA